MKTRERQKEVRREKTWSALLHPHPLCFSFIFCVFSVSVPWGLGVSWNLSIGLSLAYPVTCSPSYLFLSDHFLFHFHVSLPLIIRLYPPPPPPCRSLLGFLSLLSVCLQRVCDRAAWQEGRQADGHWDLEWLRSGASGAHGEHVFPTSVECQWTALLALNPQRGFLKQTQPLTLGKGDRQVQLQLF